MLVDICKSKTQQFCLFGMHTGLWDAVVTCFFIDTAHNIIEYIEVISRILKDGGVRTLSLVNVLTTN